MSKKPPGLEKNGPGSRKSRCKGPGVETTWNVQRTARRPWSQGVRLEVEVEEVAGAMKSSVRNLDFILVR